ncbi:MAG: dTMP kinase [bacterium]
MSVFITFEGPEGSGKTTQAELLKDNLTSQGHSVLLTREPGGTSLGEKIRTLLLDPDHGEMDALTELFLYEAARSQHVIERIQPALEEGTIVISDRFADASLVYQGMARELGKPTVEELNQLATRGLTPDLTFIMDVPFDDGLDTARQKSEAQWGEGDRIEQESGEFHRRVRNAYRELADSDPDQYLVLSKSKSIDTIQESVLNRVKEFFES